jgi:hypothetical protein
MEAHGAEDLGPECNGQAGQDHDESAEQGLEARAAGRVFVARTVDVGHHIDIASQKNAAPGAS